MAVPEDAILKLTDPSITDTDDWEVYVLSNARVVYEINGKPANLLMAYADTPLRVEGRLEAPSRSAAKNLLSKPYKPVEIVVSNVTRFSYGEMVDGPCVIWAQGRAGWFEIQPATEYKSIHDDMIEAVELLYFLTDIYNEPRKRGGGPGAQLIYQEYAEDIRFACNNPTEAQDVFHKHRVFLLMRFLTRAQGIGWSNTPIYQHYRRNFPQDFEYCKARVEGRKPLLLLPPAGETPTVKVQSDPSNKNLSPAMAKPRSVLRRDTATKLGELPKKDDNWWEAATLFEFMQKAVNQRAVRAGRGQIDLKRVAELVVRRYEIDEHQTAINVLLVHGTNLCYMMDHPKGKNKEFFKNEPIYQELTAGHRLPAADQRRAEAVELRPRRDHATLKDDASDSSEFSENDGIPSTPARRLPGKRKQGRVSVLRLKGSTYSGKGKGIKQNKSKGGKSEVHVPMSEESQVESEAEHPARDGESESDIEMGTPPQTVSPCRDKRKLSDYDTEDQEGDRRRRKRTTSASLAPESPPTSEDPSYDPALDVPTSKHAAHPLPLRHRPPNLSPSSRSTDATAAKPGLAPTLLSSPLPTYEPNGPRNSWICTFDGCSQKIYGCTRILGRQLITEHLEDHEKGREKVVGILWAEQDRLQLPVSNLIKRIREMSEATTPLFPPMNEVPAKQPQLMRRAI